MPSILEYSSEFSAVNQTENMVATLDVISNSVDSFLQSDSVVNSLTDVLKITGNQVTVSGMNDNDYPNLDQYESSLSTLSQFVDLKTIPLPKALLDQFGQMVQRCEMGIFPEIGRAWLAVDTNIFLWKYDSGTDVAYYDVLSRLIINVGLVKPKPGVFKSHIKHILVLVTIQEIILLGITFSDLDNPDNPGDLLVIQEPIFTLPSDNVEMLVIKGNQNGRIFMGGNDGNLYEIDYRSDSGWFGSRCKKINHSFSLLSYLRPSMFQWSSPTSPIIQIEFDNTRHIVYTLNQQGDIQVFDLGQDGDSFYHVVHKSCSSICNEASSAAGTFAEGNFKSIASISAITQGESLFVNLVAVTNTGVRLFFTCTSMTVGPTQRPFGLSLLHIRLPPGFAASSISHRPNNVHLAHYQRGNFIFLASSENKDTLWALSSESFAYNSDLTELYSIIPLDNKIWSFTEEPNIVPYRPFDVVHFQGKTFLSDVPALITQHLDSPKKFVFITPQGVITGNKPRIMDQLKQLLLDNEGEDNDAVRSFFHLHTTNRANACAIALIIACDFQAPGEEKLIEWATSAFFRYGTEASTLPPARNGFNSTAGQPGGDHFTPMRGQSMFRSNMMDMSPPVSPIGMNQTQQNVVSNSNEPLGRFTSQCRALFMYFSRIIRPIWNVKVAAVKVNKLPDGGREEMVVSNISVDEIKNHLMKMSLLNNFLIKNFHVNDSNRRESSKIPNICTDIGLEERNYITGLSQLIKQSMEVLNLWKLLCIHQFPLIAAGMAAEKRAQLINLSFKDVIVFGSEMTTLLASSLVRRFIEDNNSTDVINRRLQELCPSIYKNENALHAKAHEIVLKAKAIKNENDRKLMLQSALDLCKKIGTRINLPAVCELFQSVQFYEAIIELCLSTAQLYDPQNVALHFHKNREQFCHDDQAKVLFNSRMECYKILLDIYGRLSQHGKSMFSSRIAESSPDGALTPEKAKQSADEMLQMSLQTNDELFHLTLYNWLYENGQTEKMLQIKSPLLETYLKEKTQELGDSRALMDFIWVYYERTGQFRAAANVLAQLAEKVGDDIDLTKRIEYLSRAIVCMKTLDASTMQLPTATMYSGSMNSVGEFLHSLEEMMDVGRIQLQVLKEISKLDRNAPPVDEAIRTLNSRLLNITDLYNEFAHPCELYEIQLKIIHCAELQDVQLVEDIWTKILDKELQMVANKDFIAQTTLLQNKLRDLASIYSYHERLIPIEIIVQTIETAMPMKGPDSLWLARTLLELQTPLGQLIEVYHKLYKSGAVRSNDQLGMMQIILFLFDSIPQSNMMSSEKNYLYSKALDCIAGYNLDIKMCDQSDPRCSTLKAALMKTRSNIEEYLK